MKVQKFYSRGSEINKLQFSEIEDYLTEKGLNADEAFNVMADENEYVYVSNGFLRGLTAESNDAGEWHHFFKKDGDNYLEAGNFAF